MDDVLSGGKLKLVVEAGPKAGLPVVEATGLVDRDQDIVIKMPRVGILGGPVLPHVHRTEQAPGSGAGEALARHCREGFDHGGRPHPGGMPQLVGKPPPGHLDRIVGHAALRWLRAAHFSNAGSRDRRSIGEP